MLDSKGGRLLVRPLSVTTLVVQYSNSRLVKRFPQTALCSNKFILIYCSFDWLHGCKYSARKYIVRMTECLFRAPPCCPVGSELHCHSQLFIRLHMHPRSITVLPPGPVTSLYVYYSVPPSRGRWLTFSERTEVGLARFFFSNRGSRGGGFSSTLWLWVSYQT